MASRLQVQEEINRVNKQMAGRSSTNMTFQRGGINVRPPPLHPLITLQHEYQRNTFPSP